jgi:hypothetical protein
VAIFTHPLLADAINIPFVLGLGLVVLVPLMLFEVGIEALILSKVWRLPYGNLCRYSFLANCWSLAAGIPTKILNSFLYGMILFPLDMAGFLARYPFAVTIGSLIFFLVTILVEGAYAFRWLRRNEFTLVRQQIWRGVILANLASYAVVAPLHYYLTRPINDVREFTRDARWTSHPATKVIFTAADNGYLKAVNIDGSAAETIMPVAAKDYLVSADLNICLFRGKDGNLYLYRRDRGQTNIIWKTNERFRMDEVAFSPSAGRVAIVTENGKNIEVVEVKTGRRICQPFLGADSPCYDISLAWSKEETKFYVTSREKHFVVTVGTKLHLTTETLNNTNTPEWNLAIETFNNTNGLEFLTCYGRICNEGRWGGGDDWGASFGIDECSGLRAWSTPGLGSNLRIYRKDQNKCNFRVLTVAVNPGLLRLGSFSFEDVVFLDGCGECLFQANDYLYLLDIDRKRVGTVVKGERFILLTPRYQKHL